MKIPELNDGERYAGIILNEDGSLSHHLILLPQKQERNATWDEAMIWAATICARLPTRQESRLLFINLKTNFAPIWYWTAEESEDFDCHAWIQLFDFGNQHEHFKDNKGPARAVRRVLITEN